MKWERLCALGHELPEVAEGRWYRTAALNVRGRYFVRLKEDGQSVVFRLENLDEQEFLTASRGDLYYVTEHYRGYRAILARLAVLPVSECRQRLETAWRAVAPKALLKQRELARLSKRG
ncbi:MAG: MmcQ/YjbR family DNA-binding protein [Myxococcaceae bacterium]